MIEWRLWRNLHCREGTEVNWNSSFKTVVVSAKIRTRHLQNTDKKPFWYLDVSWPMLVWSFTKPHHWILIMVRRTYPHKPVCSRTINSVDSKRQLPQELSSLQLWTEDSQLKKQATLGSNNADCAGWWNFPSSLHCSYVALSLAWDVLNERDVS